MSIALDLISFNFLENHLDFYPQKNMHTRDYKMKSKKRQMKYCNLIKKVNANLISCHISGGSLDIRFDISKNNGAPIFTVLTTSETLPETDRIINREFKRMIDRAHLEIASRNRKMRINYLKKNYYIQRNNTGAAPGAAFLAASSLNLFSHNFLQNVYAWNFKIIEGHN